MVDIFTFVVQGIVRDQIIPSLSGWRLARSNPIPATHEQRDGSLRLRLLGRGNQDHLRLGRMRRLRRSVSLRSYAGKPYVRR